MHMRVSAPRLLAPVAILLLVVAVLAGAWAFGFGPAPKAQAQTYFQTVVERDSSTYIWINPAYPYRTSWYCPYRICDTSGYFAPSSTRLQWYNSQGYFEYSTLPRGTRWIRIYRGSGRALYIYCYR